MPDNPHIGSSFSSLTEEEHREVEIWLGPNGTRSDALMCADVIIAKARHAGGNIKKRTAAVLREKIADGILQYTREYMEFHDKHGNMESSTTLLTMTRDHPI